MNTKTTITFKTDKKLRDQAKKVADQLGIPLTTVMNVQLADFVREKTFTVSAYPRVRNEKMEMWKKISEDIRNHPEKTSVEDITDFIKELRA
jgi:addiction module RelB/DinJ family antitoxin